MSSLLRKLALLGVSSLCIMCSKPEPRYHVGAEPTDHLVSASRAADAPAGEARAPEDGGGAPAVPAPPAKVESILVPGDLSASVVRGAPGKAPLSVFVAGICSNAAAYLHTFPESARAAGGVVAIEGDQFCGGSKDYHSYSWDAGRLHLRVEAALAAAGLGEIPKEGITLVGYSQGAALAEQMIQRWPRRYTRLVLIGAPTDPEPRTLARARAVVTMSCDRDVPQRMRGAASRTNKLGTPALYVEMKGCSHGNITDGERTFATTFDWLREHELPTPPDAIAMRIAGSNE